MVALIAAAALWVALHLGLAGTSLRGALAARLGEGGFRAGFSLLSVLGLSLLVAAFSAAPAVPLWTAPGWLRVMLVVAMVPAFVLFAAAVAAPNPTAVGGGLDRPVRGFLRITRHPMLWSFAIWAVVHALGNGEGAALLFFGAFAVTALAGMPSIDAKIARRDPAGWRGFAAGTSAIPFAAILAGRNRLVLRELGWLAPALGVLAWAALLHWHPRLFGVSPLPAG